MGNWSLYGILLSVAIFFGLTAWIFSSISVDNPLTGSETSFLAWIIDAIF
jgi:hypothetical protein